MHLSRDNDGVIQRSMCQCYFDKRRVHSQQSLEMNSIKEAIFHK